MTASENQIANIAASIAHSQEKWAPVFRSGMRQDENAAPSSRLDTSWRGAV